LTYFSDLNFHVLENAKTRLLIDDGRHFLLTTKEKFDGITSDPLDPWVTGTAALYTKEFFQSARRHLNPGGVVTQFVQLYNVSEDAVKSEIATFFEVFPNGVIFANTVSGLGYDLVLMGRAEDLPINVDSIEERLNSTAYSSMRRSMTEIGISSAVELLFNFCRPAVRPETMVERCCNQPRSQPAVAIPRRTRARRAKGGYHFQRHYRPRAVPRKPLYRFRCADESPAPDNLF